LIVINIKITITYGDIATVLKASFEIKVKKG